MNDVAFKEFKSKNSESFIKRDKKEEETSESFKINIIKQIKNIILLGPPASGKGTQCEYLKEKFNLIHISTGDLLRNEVKLKTNLGIKAFEFMNCGKLVPDELILEMVATL